jgi:hypothetical protein
MLRHHVFRPYSGQRLEGCLQPGFSTVVSNPRTNIDGITSEGDVTMFSNLEPTKYAVNGSGLQRARMLWLG